MIIYVWRAFKKQIASPGIDQTIRNACKWDTNLFIKDYNFNSKKINMKQQTLRHETCQIKPKSFQTASA